MKPIHPHDDLLRSVHRNQFAPRRSDLPHGYFDPPPWMTRTPVRWAVIAVIAICAYAMCAIQGDLSDEEIPYATTKAGGR